MNVDITAINNALVNDYGLIEGMRIGSVVIPNILDDFENMLANAPRSVIVREDYNFDDIRGTIHIEGQDGKIIAMTVNKRTIV